MQELSKYRDGALKAANLSSEMIKNNFYNKHNIIHKGVVDLVTEVDLASEKILKEELTNKFPEIKFYGEESGGQDWRNGDFWIVDPIDGTTNFANRLPHFSISIALCHNGIPLVGIVKNPINNETFIGVKNEGAYCKERIDDSVIDLQTRLGLKIPPIHIECTDIAHIQGVDPVASVVVCENGKLKKSEYRLFHIKEAMGGDDPASIGEIVRRRFSRLLSEQRPLPDLFIVDGGITQLHSAMHELEKLGIHDQQIMGLAKKEELLVQTDGREVKLPFSSPGMRVIIKLRNEAHRFCHTFQSKTHTQRTLRSSLLNLPGVGPVILKKLILEFGSIENVIKVTPDEIVNRCHIPLKVAELIVNSI